MLAKVLKFGGIILIIGFCVMSTIYHHQSRELTEAERTYYKTPVYASFLEDRFFDLRMKRYIDSEARENRIVLAAIDDQSLQSIGRWPWSRVQWSKFMDKMTKYGAKVVAFDVFYSEPEVACNQESPDEGFAAAIARFQEKEGNRVIIPFSMQLNTHDTARTFATEEELPDFLLFNLMDSKVGPNLSLAKNLVSTDAWPIETLTNVEPMLGHIQSVTDIDGIYRHYMLVSNTHDYYLPSFSVATYEAFTGQKTTLTLVDQENTYLLANDVQFPVDYHGRMKIRWFGDTSNFPQVSMKELLEAPENDTRMEFIFKDNIVFVASTAYGAHDLRHTPLDPQSPGVLVHMNVVKQLLSGIAFKPLSESIKVTWLILIITTLLIIVVQLMGNALIDIVALLTIVTTAYFVDLYFLIPAGYEVGLFFCLLSVVSCYSWTTFLNFYLANKDKAFLKSAFSTYISPELIDDMYKSGEPPKLGGDCGVRTAMFTDIQGFSTFSEQLTATQLVELLNEYLTVMTDILLEEKGTLDKYEGDAIIAFFGAPMPLADHAARACMVAHRMQVGLANLREKWTSEGDKWPKIVHEMRMRIGLNSGEIVTGNMGSAQRMNYTMMGDSVNLAARLEESAKQYGIFSQIAEETVKIAGDEFLFRELDTIRVVGKTLPVTTFELLSTKKDAPDYLLKLATLFKEGIDLYKSQKFDEATLIFNQTLELEWQRFPELKGVKTNPSEVYLKRCEEFKQLPPPPEWDGVYTLTSK